MSHYNFEPETFYLAFNCNGAPCHIIRCFLGEAGEKWLSYRQYKGVLGEPPYTIPGIELMINDLQKRQPEMTQSWDEDSSYGTLSFEGEGYRLGTPDGEDLPYFIHPIPQDIINLFLL